MSIKFFINQRVIIGNEICTVDIRQSKEPIDKYVWVYVPSRGYESNYSVDNVKPLPNGQL